MFEAKEKPNKWLLIALCLGLLFTAIWLYLPLHKQPANESDPSEFGQPVDVANHVTEMLESLDEVESSISPMQSQADRPEESMPEQEAPKDVPIPEALAHLVERLGSPAGPTQIVDFRVINRSPDQNDGLLEIHYVEDRGPEPYVPGRYRYIRHEVLAEGPENQEVGRIIHVANRLTVYTERDTEAFNEFLAPFNAEVSYAFTELPGRYTVLINDPMLDAQNDLFNALEQDPKTMNVAFQELIRTDE